MTGGRSSIWGMASLTAWSLFGLTNIVLAFQLDRTKRREIQKEEADTGTDKEREKLSSISESSESGKERNIKISNEMADREIKSEVKVDGVEIMKEPVIKKKNSMMQFNYLKSIVTTSEIPKVKFPKRGKTRGPVMLNCSYDPKREHANTEESRISSSQTYLPGAGSKKEIRLRMKSTSINFDKSVDLTESQTEKK
jgi:hypothetical protein